MQKPQLLLSKKGYALRKKKKIMPIKQSNTIKTLKLRLRHNGFKI
jgi:hypothetical protein